MSNRRNTTKIIVNNLVGFGIGSVTSNVVHNSITKTGNPVLDAVITVSAFTTSWFVSSAVQNPVRTETNRQIDALFDAIEQKPSTN